VSWESEALWQGKAVLEGVTRAKLEDGQGFATTIDNILWITCDAAIIQNETIDKELLSSIRIFVGRYSFLDISFGVHLIFRCLDSHSGVCSGQRVKVRGVTDFPT
jgi:hypothetical protein